MTLNAVMAGPVPAIVSCLLKQNKEDVNARDKHGHDDREAVRFG